MSNEAFTDYAAKSAPLVSVIMPVYNAGAYLRPAVDSVLRQTHANLELILIDDGSTDGCVATLDDIRDPRLRRIRQENAGKPVAMNRGLALARGEFYTINDADDLSHPRRLERQLACLLEDARLAGVFCGYWLIVNGRELAPFAVAKSIEECAEDIWSGRMPGHDPTAMYRVSLVKEIQYTEDLPVVEGFDYILRVGEKYSLKVLGESLYGYRLHPESVTRRDPARRNQLLQELIDRMNDRRGQPRRPAAVLQDGARNRHGDADNDIVSHFSASVGYQILADQRWGAIRAGLMCYTMHPLSYYYLKPLVYSLVPRWAVELMRDRRRSRRPIPANLRAVVEPRDSR